MPFNRGVRQGRRDIPKEEQVSRGLFAWFKSYFGVTTSGSNVTTWADFLQGLQITEALHQPTLTSNVRNGLPSITFNGTNQALSQVTGGNGLLTATNGAAGITCAIAMNPSAYNGAIKERPVYIGVGSGGAISSARFAVEVPLGTTPLGRALTARRVDTDSVATQTTSTTWAVGAEIIVASIDYTNKTGTIYRNGVQVLAPTTMLTAGSASATDSLGFSVGGGLLTNTPTYQNLWAGDIYEILVHNVALSQTEALKQTTYLNSVWEIY